MAVNSNRTGEEAMNMQEMVAKRVRELATERNMPLSVLAEKSGLSRNTVYNVCSAKYDVSMYTLIQIANSLDIEMAELFPGERETLFSENEEEREAVERYRGLSPLQKARVDGYLYAMMESNQIKFNETGSET